MPTPNLDNTLLGEIVKLTKLHPSFMTLYFLPLVYLSKSSFSTNREIHMNTHKLKGRA